VAAAAPDGLKATATPRVTATPKTLPPEPPVPESHTEVAIGKSTPSKPGMLTPTWTARTVIEPGLDCCSFRTTEAIGGTENPLFGDGFNATGIPSTDPSRIPAVPDVPPASAVQALLTAVAFASGPARPATDAELATPLAEVCCDDPFRIPAVTRPGTPTPRTVFDWPGGNVARGVGGTFADTRPFAFKDRPDPLPDGAALALAAHAPTAIPATANPAATRTTQLRITAHLQIVGLGPRGHPWLQGVFGATPPNGSRSARKRPPQVTGREPDRQRLLAVPGRG
jgi:hypothetical protein